MNVNSSIDWTELCIQWMLTCGHFLWQGLVVALVFLAIERLAVNRASARYALACTTLLSLPICVMLTFALVHHSRGSMLNATRPSIDSRESWDARLATNSPSIGLDSPINNLSNTDTAPPRSTESSELASTNQTAPPQPAPFTQRVRFLAPMISAAYAIVVALLFVRMGLSILGSFRFGSVAQRITDAQFLQLVSAQARQLRLRTVPIVATCLRVSSPVVVGIVRPMILLPPSLLGGLDANQLAAILSHEMAHIRRYDLLVNLFKRAIEALLFFHPITWWISRRVAIERENCCDDVAALQVGRLNYAQALIQMATLCLANHRSRSQALATLSADGGNSTDFGYRIRRLIDAQETPKIRVTKRSFVFCLATLALMGASYLSFAQSPQPHKEEAQVTEPSKDSLVDGVQWSTWGDHDGLLSGARLILPEGGVQPGQSVVVEYRLKNVSKETKKFTCYVRSNWQYITLESKNRIRDMGIDSSDQSLEITVEPGKEYVEKFHTATIDTRGLSPGDYQVALGTAFWLPDKVNPGAKVEIPHRGSLPLTILGEPNTASAILLDDSIHWGKAISGLRLGAKFRQGNNSFAVGDVVEADLWIANVTDQPIECSIRLPHPMDGWLFNVVNHLGDNIMLERPPLALIFSPQEFYSLKLAPGEVKALTGDRVEGQPSMFAGRRAKFEIVSKKEAKSSEDYTIKGRLVAQSGNYSAIYSVMLERPDIPGLRVELDTDNVRFTVSNPSADLPSVEPENRLEGNQKEAVNRGNTLIVGALQGRITLEGSVPKLPKLRVPTTTSPRLTKQATKEARKIYEASLVEIEDESLQVDAASSLANAFVYMEKAPSNWKPTKNDLKPITLTLQDSRFEPRAAIVQTGQDMRLINSGSATDNFSFQPRGNTGLNRLIEAGTEITLERPFENPENIPFQASSNMNVWKKSFLLPLDHPFAAVTDKHGRFFIDGLPPGTHTFQVWHERTGWLEKSLKVSIEAGRTSEVNRSFGIDRLKLAANQIVPSQSLTNVLWGESVGGLRLGIRQSEFARRSTVLRHGEHLEYEVWIKNETDEVVSIGRDPRDLHRPGLNGDRTINVIGSGMWLSFGIPPDELAKSELILPPGHAARRFLEQTHSASIRPPGSPRGRFGSAPLLLEPGKYNVFAQVGDLKSAVEEVEILPAARLQIRKSSLVTDKKREMAAENPSDAILEWQSGDGSKQEAMINWDHGIFIDERDLATVESVPVEGKPDQYSIALKLRSESANWLSRRIASYSLWDDPDMVAILLDGKPLGAIRIPATIREDTLIIPVGLTLKQAEATMNEIRAAMVIGAQPKAPPADTTAMQPQGIKLVGEVKLPKDEWLFRRQVKQLPDIAPRERPRDFKGDSIDPVDGHLIHELSWKDIVAVNVTVKANDGRDYLETVQTDLAGKFHFDEALPFGSYQIDVNAVLTMDDDSQAIDGLPAADLRSGTQLLQVKQGDAGDKSLEFELHPVPYSYRLIHSDPAQRTTILVTLTANNRSVSNAKIILYAGEATRKKIAESKSDDRGQCRFENVIRGLIGVQVKHQRLVPADGKSWRDMEVEFGTTQQLDLPLTSGGFITGQLLEENKQPRTGVPLRIMLTAAGVRKDSTHFVAYATTDDTGSFTSEPLYPGKYVVEENRDGYPVVGEVEVEANQTTKL